MSSVVGELLRRRRPPPRLIVELTVADDALRGRLDVLELAKLTARRHPGAMPLVLVAGERRLELGELWGVDGTPACLAALSEFGHSEQVHERR